MMVSTKDENIESVCSKKLFRPLKIKCIRYGAITGIFGTLCVVLQPLVMEKVIRSQIKIDPWALSYQFWKKIPVPIITKFYFFNVENPNQFLKGDKLKVREVGPFVLEEDRWKEIIEFRDKTVKYYEWRNYQINHEKSNGSWDQEITVINPISVSLGTIIGDKLEQLIPVPLSVSPFIYSVISAVLLVHSQNFFIKTTPRKLISGDRINLLDTVSMVIKPLELLGIKNSDILPTTLLPNNTFGILLTKNYTRIGPWEVFTGVNVPKELYASTISYENQRLMNRWAGSECNTPRGTDGVQYQPGISRSSKLTVFVGEIYRSFDLTYAEDSDYFGIPVYKFIMGPEVFLPTSLNVKNRCYCVQPDTKKSRCDFFGALDCTGSFKGPPLVITRPHFLDTDSIIQNQVDGLRPDPKIHEFYLLVKPEAGIPISGKVRFQFNLRTENIPFFRGFDNIRDTVFPLGWLELTAELKGFYYYAILVGLVFTPIIMSVGFYAISIVGWVAFLGGLLALAISKFDIDKVKGIRKLFDRRLKKDDLSNEFEKSSKIAGSNIFLLQNSKSLLNEVHIPIDYSPLSEYRESKSYISSSPSISMIPIKIQDIYYSSVWKFYQPSSQMNAEERYNLPRVAWTDRKFKSAKPRKPKSREKLTRRSLPVVIY